MFIMPENSEKLTFNPGPPPEHFKKFQAPEWKSEMPDIRMQAGKRDNMDPKEKARLDHLLRENELFGANEREGKIDTFVTLVKGLKAYEKDEGKQEQIREKLAETYSELCQSQITEINSINKYLENLKGNIQYDTRWTIQMMERLLEEVNKPLREKDKFNSEGLALLKTFKKDVLWTLSMARITEAIGPSYEIYFDGELQMAQLRTVNRTEILASDFMNVFSKETSGLELNSDEKTLAAKTLNKIKPENIASPEGMREKAVEYFDESNYWGFASTAMAQKNLETGFNGQDTEAGEHYMDIDPVTYRFLSKLLDTELSDSGDVGEDLKFINDKGEKIVVKESVLNINNMPKSAETKMRRYYATMHELVVDSKTIRAALNKILQDRSRNVINDVDVETAVNDLADKYITKVNGRTKNWDALDENNIYDRVADTAIGGLINIDRGMFACGEMGWSYEYSKKYLYDMSDAERFKYVGQNAEKKNSDKVQEEPNPEGGPNRKFVVVRTSELGSIYDNHDITTVVFTARHLIDYDNFADTRGSIIQPSIGSYRDRWNSEPPYWKPTFEEFAPTDNKLKEILDIWQNDKWKNVVVRKQYEKGKKGWQQQFYGEIDPQIKAFIRENAWPFVTPWLSEPGKGSDEYLLTQVVLLPTWIPEINGWRNFSLEEPSAKIKDTYGSDGNIKENKSGKSIWHKRINGNNLSELKWENLNRYGYNWFRVNTDQMSRWLGPWITLHDYNKLTADEFVKHNAMPSGKTEKEGGKRGRLGGRGSKWNEGVIRATILAQAKVLASVQYSKVMGLQLDPKLKGNLDIWRESWIAAWINTLIDMPYTVRKVKNYNGSISQIVLGTYLQTRRIVEAAIKHSDGQAGDVQTSVLKIEEKFL